MLPKYCYFFADDYTMLDYSQPIKRVKGYIKTMFLIMLLV